MVWIFRASFPPYPALGCGDRYKSSCLLIWQKARLRNRQHLIDMAVLCSTVNPETCQKYGANSYPTLTWFGSKESDKGVPYQGGRSLSAIKKYIKKQIDPEWEEVLGPFVNSEAWKDEDHGNGKVVHLDDDYFAEYRKDHPKLITMFYAPWCGHCKSFKPEYVAASEEVSDDVILSAIDCTVSGEVCSKYGVEGYPTVKYFEDTNSDPLDYDGS
eukprot:SAG11_NODE_10565_length_821_cov_0.869806_2_plen_213_part_01